MKNPATQADALPRRPSLPTRAHEVEWLIRDAATRAHELRETSLAHALESFASAIWGWQDWSVRDREDALSTLAVALARAVKEASDA